MGKTILELFQTQPLNQGPFVGQTAEDAYVVRDFKKETPLSGPSPLLNSTGFALANVARRNLSIRKRETFIEQETTGIRIVRLGAIPVIYGTDLLRITQRTTNVLDAMKSASNDGAVADAGLVGNALNKAKESATKFASKLGIEFPQKLIPSRIVLNSKFLGSEEPDTMTILAEIKKDGAGSLVGKFLAKNVSGTPTQIANSVVGGAIKGVKAAVRKKLFGSRTEAGQNLAKKKEGGVDYSSKTKYSKTVDATNDDIIGRNDLSSKAEVLTLLDSNGIIQNRNKVSAVEYGNGSLTGLRKDADDVFERRDLSTQLVMERGIYEETSQNPGLFPIMDIPTYPNRKNKNKYFYTDDKQQRYAYEGISNFSTDNIRDVVITGEKRGMGSGADTINGYDAGEVDSENKIDFVTLKFDTTQFRATITGLSETYSPSWDSNRFIGSPFNYYTYSGIERNVTFNFKVFSLNITEHKKCWNKLQSLAKKTYPKGYVAYGVVAPIIDFTMTDLYKSKKSFIESLSFTIDDNYPWEVFVEGLRLPHIIDVAITLKFIEQRDDEAKLYDFDKNTNITQVKRPGKTNEQKILDKKNQSITSVDSGFRTEVNGLPPIESVDTDDGDDFVRLMPSTTILPPKGIGNIPPVTPPSSNVERVPQLPSLTKDTKGDDSIKQRNKISKVQERKATFGSQPGEINKDNISKERANDRQRKGKFNQTISENRNTAWYLLEDKKKIYANKGPERAQSLKAANFRGKINNLLR